MKKTFKDIENEMKVERNSLVVRYHLNGFINGKPIRYLWDTGNSVYGVIDASVLHELGIDVFIKQSADPIRINGITNEPIPVRGTADLNVTFPGSTHIARVPFIIVDNRIDGVTYLGGPFSFFHQLNVTTRNGHMSATFGPNNDNISSALTISIQDLYKASNAVTEEMVTELARTDRKHTISNPLVVAANHKKHKTSHEADPDQTSLECLLSVFGKAAVSTDMFPFPCVTPVRRQLMNEVEAHERKYFYRDKSIIPNAGQGWFANKGLTVASGSTVGHVTGIIMTRADWNYYVHSNKHCPLYTKHIIELVSLGNEIAGTTDHTLVMVMDSLCTGSYVNDPTGSGKTANCTFKENWEEGPDGYYMVMADTVTVQATNSFSGEALVSYGNYTKFHQSRLHLAAISTLERINIPVHLTQPITLHAASQHCINEAKINVNRYPHLVGKTVITQPGIIPGTFTTAGSVICTVQKDGTIPYLLCNLSNKQQVLPARSVIGSVQLADTAISPITVPVACITANNVPKCNENNSIPFNMSNTLTTEEKERLQSILSNFTDILVADTAITGLTHLGEHRIDTGEAIPIRQPPIRWDPASIRAQDEYINKCVSEGILYPCESPWASPTVIVCKKDGSPRTCVDYRKLNHITKKDSYPLPRIDESLDALGGKRYFSNLDLLSGYHQIKVAEEDQEKTALITHKGLWCYRTMPFGLCNAPSTFQRIMNLALSGLAWKNCLVYLDDIIIFSNTFEEHLADVQTVLEAVRQAGFKIKNSKCMFGANQLRYLGHIVGSQGIAIDKDRLEPVLNYPRPTTLKELKRFLGLIDYYRSFVFNHVHLTAPLRRLNHKGLNIVERWTAECDAAMDLIKEALTTAPVLASPDFNQEFIVYTDASQTGFGAILAQQHDGKDKPVYFASRVLQSEERNYPAIELECAAVIWALKKFRPYLDSGRKFTIVTDHQPLVWLQKAKVTTGKLSRWWTQIQGYNFNIIYRKGSQNVNVDTLSRIYEHKRHPVTLTDMELTEPNGRKPGNGNITFKPNYGTNLLLGATKLKRKLVTKQINLKIAATVIARESNKTLENYINTHANFAQLQQEDPSLLPLINYIKAGKITGNSIDQVRLQRLLKTHFIRNDLLYHTWRSRGYRYDPVVEFKEQLVIPKSLVPEILKWSHDTVCGAHLGVKKTFARLNEKYYWDTMYYDINSYINTCTKCQQSKIPHYTSKIPLLARFPASEPFAVIGMDLIGPLPATLNKQQYLLVITDQLTRFVEVFAIPDKSAYIVARFIFEEIICRYGCPKTIVTDQGGEFVNTLLKEILDTFKVRHVTTTPYHPQGNSIVERFNQVMITMLQPYVNDLHTNWDIFAPSLAAAYNATPHSVTGFAPYYALFGRHATTVMDNWIYVDPAKNISVNEYVNDIRSNLNLAHALCQARLQQATDEHAIVPIDWRPFRKFKVGDYVWFFRPKRSRAKLDKPFIGPFRVTKIRSNVTYDIEPLHGDGTSTVHVGHLKLCRLRSADDIIVEDDTRPVYASRSHVHTPEGEISIMKEHDIEPGEPVPIPLATEFKEVEEPLLPPEGPSDPSLSLSTSSPMDIDTSTTSSDSTPSQQDQRIFTSPCFTTPEMVVKVSKPQVRRSSRTRRKVDRGPILTNGNSLEVAEFL